jgi:hypothetical protein
MFSLQGKDASKLAGNWSQHLMALYTNEQQNYFIIYVRFISALPFNSNITCPIETKDLKPNQT